VLKKHQHLRAKLFTAPDTTATATTATGNSDTSDNDDDSTADNNSEETTAVAAAVHGSIIAGYDPQKRDPRFAFSSTASSGNGQQAQFQPLWEVTLLKWHYHPSVQHFASQLLTPPGHGIRYH
jgi:CBF/Mak21 family